MIDADDLDTDDPGKRPLDRASVSATLLCSVALGVLGVAIIAVGIFEAFQQ